MSGKTHKRLCKARSSRTGKPCKKAPINGGTVCDRHGGRAPQVKRKAQERLADLIDPDRALREAAKLAYSDITQLFNDKGQFLPMKEWPEHIRAAVSSVEVVKRNLASDDGVMDEVLKVKVWDKPKNLEMLFKHLNLFKEMVEHSGELTIKWEE